MPPISERTASWSHAYCSPQRRDLGPGDGRGCPMLHHKHRVFPFNGDRTDLSPQKPLCSTPEAKGKELWSPVFSGGRYSVGMATEWVLLPTWASPSCKGAAARPQPTLARSAPTVFIQTAPWPGPQIHSSPQRYLLKLGCASHVLYQGGGGGGGQLRKCGPGQGRSSKGERRGQAGGLQSLCGVSTRTPGHPNI